MNKLWLYGFGVLAATALVLSFVGKEAIYSFVSSPLSSSTPAVAKPLSVLFFGDMMFDRDIRKVGAKQGYSYLFSCITSTLQDQDLIVANLEGPITSHASVSKSSQVGTSDNFTFTFDPAVTDALVLANIGVVNIGNNHILNFGKEGVLQTIGNLTKAGIQYFGDPATSSGALLIDRSGIHLSFINYNQFAGPTEGETIATIKEQQQSGRIVIVYTHWGEEYLPPTPAVRELAHRFIDAGADAIIGSHPHVVLEHEFYNGHPIFYSLGNFIFDQYFTAEVSHGLGVRLLFTPGFDPQIEELPVELLRDGRTCPVAPTSTPALNSHYRYE